LCKVGFCIRVEISLKYLFLFILFLLIKKKSIISTYVSISIGNFMNININFNNISKNISNINIIIIGVIILRLFIYGFVYMDNNSYVMLN